MFPLDITGIGCLVPDADTLDGFWDNLVAGKRSIRTADKQDWGVDPTRFMQPGRGIADHTSSIELGKPVCYDFDPNGYLLPPEFLTAQDRCIQWPLAVARTALSDAGMWPGTDLSRVGIVLGSYAWAASSASDAITRPLYDTALAQALASAAPNNPLQLSTGRVTPSTHPESARVSGGITTTLAQALGLGGPRYAIDAACATSLYAIYLAALHIASGEADSMLVVAANAFDTLFANFGFAATQALPDGSTNRPFDIGSDGVAPADGAVALVLRRAAGHSTQAYGTVRAIGLSSDGRGQTLTAPNPKGQLLACERAYAQSGIDPASVAYVECHATGTRLGDRVELETVAKVFGPNQPVGSVKSNVGHLLTAAGVAGLVKTLLAMRHNNIPATVGILNPLSREIAGTPAILMENTPWPGSHKRAAINAFGFGGVNAHLILDGPGQAGGEQGPSRRKGGTALLTGMGAAIGDCPDLVSVAQALAAGRPRLRPLPEERHAGLSLPCAAPAGAYLERVAIDALRLRVPPNDIVRMHPQQLLMLSVADAALHDAGIVQGSRTAVIIAGSMDHSGHRLMARWESSWRLEDSLDAAGFKLTPEERSGLTQAVREALHNPVDAVVMLSYVGSLLASRIAATWDFSGPAFMLTGDETGALRAMDLGAQLLAEGEADAVLVGAVDLAGAIENLMVRLAAGRDISQPLGEGACAIVLEPSAAVQQRAQPAYAEWRGAGFGSTAAAAARNAGNASAIPATSVGLFETTETLPAASLLGGRPALASAAAVFGHSRMVAPLLGTLHAALALNARTVPVWAGWKERQKEEKIPHGLSEADAYVPTEARPWFRPAAGRRIAAILAQDADGSSAQGMLAEVPDGVAAKAIAPALPLLFPLAAENSAALTEHLTALARELGNGADAAELCRAAVRDYQAGPPLALALVADDKTELLVEATAALAQLSKGAAEWQSPRGSRYTSQPLGREGKLAFVYSALNTAFTGLAATAAQLAPQCIEQMTTAHHDAGRTIGSAQLYPQSLAPLTPDARMQIEEQLLQDNNALINAGILSSWQYTKLLTERIGLRPGLLFGHSLGQSSMLFANGVWTPGDAWSERLKGLDSTLAKLSGDKQGVRELWQLPPEAPVDWVNFLVLAPAAAVVDAARHEPRAYVSLINAPDEVTLVGERAACARILHKLSADAVPAPDSLAMHCAPAAQEHANIAACFSVPIGAQPAGLLFAGGAPRSWDSEALAERIAGDLVAPLDFPALTEQAYAEGARLFLELGPGANCSRWIGKTLQGRPHASFALGRRDQSDATMFIRLLALLVTHRVPLDLAAILDTPPLVKKPALYKDLVFGKPAIGKTLVESLRKQGLDQVLSRPLEKPQPITTMPATATRNSMTTSDTHHTPPAPLPPADASLHNLLQNLEQQAQQHGAQLATQHAALANLLNLNPSPPPAAQHNGLAANPSPAREILFGEADIMEFAEGRVANVLGPQYAAIDNLPRRVRVPGPPFMAVSRVTRMSGTHGKLEDARIRTEYDIPDPAWNAVDGQVSYLSLDAQGVLFLVGWLGIDFENQGQRAYRWLDAQLTYLGPMPQAGQRVEYDIHIKQSFRNGDATLFKTDFLAHVDGQPMLKIEHCTAGFFTYEELAKGAGITDQHRTPRKVTQSGFRAPLTPPGRALENADLIALARGDIAQVLSPAHATGGRNPSLRIPPPVIQFIDRVTRIESGGAYGLGVSEAEFRLDPQHWAIRAHFKDDPIFPGPCMMEGAFQLLQIHALALGLQTAVSGARFQPVPDRPILVRFRAQVLPQNQLFGYRADIVEIGLGPEPYLIADIDLIDNGRVVGRVEGLGIRLVGQSAPQSSHGTLAPASGVAL
ncbi:beta-ketoacyl synthase N-terminal-like domain-containing protein [Collimonas sp.]|jgi:PfaB family protein|uniref:beta-ketoacyl synthase N-terminal-like domain-containing protein n=1 Tax=Collimonas sp. TaxID=1963772 RepID=UPI002B50B74B|nr:beta-ketoacyl synthase N-terminal-like domain-containing protein [Collimonas sp.]HWX00155.1 beta-ketoacyl synthase N-terminal-like domain-containing protein [Collimonas sp.]